MRVASLCRYPIKSHGRERIEQVALSAGKTMPWDRFWAVTHEATQFDKDAPEWAHCRNFMRGAGTPGLAAISATLIDETRTVRLTHPNLQDITFCPDDPADVAHFLKWVAPLCSDDRAAPQDVVSAPEQGMTDSPFPSISIMNMASHDAVADAMQTTFDIERWRGNIWLDGLPAWAEMDWIDRDVRIGDAVLRVRERIQRCSLTNANPTTGVRDTDTLGALNTHFGHQDFGVNAEVVTSGSITIGATAELI